MKRTITLILLAFFTNIAIVNAQKGKELVLGVSGGITNVWIVNQNFYGEPEIDYAPKMGYAGLFTLGYNITESLSIMTELQYSLQGQKYDGKQTGQITINNFDYDFRDVKRDIDLRYLNIPLFFKSSFGDKMTRFRFMVGPQIGILLEAQQEYTRDGKKQGPKVENKEHDLFTPYENSIDERFEKTDISIALDVGADVHLSDKFYVTGSFRGNYGFKDINAPAYQIKNNDGEYMPSHNLWGGIFVGIGYKIDVQGYSQRSF